LPRTNQYFAETDFHSTTKRFGAVSHHDVRFAPTENSATDLIRQSLTALLKSYIAIMDELRVETWVAHGALLGWYWNRALLPWDTDLDFQMSAESMAFLAKSHNMTEYHYSTSDEEAAGTYLLDINPHYSITSNQDVANKTDGRWIDTTNGKFIDITVVHREEVKANIMFYKDGHRCKVSPQCCEQSPQTPKKS
jgi:LicD family